MANLSIFGQGFLPVLLLSFLLLFCSYSVIASIFKSSPWVTSQWRNLPKLLIPICFSNERITFKRQQFKYLRNRAILKNHSTCKWDFVLCDSSYYMNKIYFSRLHFTIFPTLLNQKRLFWHCWSLQSFGLGVSVAQLWNVGARSTYVWHSISQRKDKKKLCFFKFYFLL